MPSTYSPDLRIELIANGEQSGTWGGTTNNNLGTLIEDAIAGRAAVTTGVSPYTLTALNGVADEARCAALELNTSTGANYVVIVPAVTKLYVVENVNGTYSAEVKTASGSGVVVPPLKTVLLRCDGTNVVEQLDQVVGSFGVGGDLNVSGGLSLSGNAALTSNLAVIGGTALGVEQSASISIGTPAVVTVAASPAVNAPVVFKTSGALPAGLTVGTVYYVLSTGRTATTFRVSTSIGGSAVNTTGAGSGSHTVYTAAFGSTPPAGTSDTQLATTQFASTAALAGGTFTNAINFATPVTVASAATTDIGAVASNVVNVTGTTTITSFGTANAGAVRIVNFSGVLTLTFNATSLILPGSSDITTVAGDVAIFESLGSGNWQCVSYTKRNIIPGAAGFTNISTAQHPTTVTNTTGVPMANTGTGTFNFTVPTGIFKLKVTVVAGGGGGGGIIGNNSNFTPSGGGGGAGGATVSIINVTPGNVIAVTVGAGGTAGSAGNTGGTGGSSSFGAFCSATGGSGGGGATAGFGAGGAGGTATGGAVNISGQSGHMGVYLAGSSTNNGSVNPSVGNGGDSGFGLGFGGNAITNQSGPAGTGYGGGGAGGSANGIQSLAGGAGAAGIVIVEF
jgi:hypothetical protein